MTGVTILKTGELGLGDYVAGDLCWEPLTGQGDVKCWRNKDHLSPHEDIACPPCSACGGLNMHHEGCERSNETTREIVFVQWPGVGRALAKHILALAAVPDAGTEA